jgi:hypothetical protein
MRLELSSTVDKHAAGIFNALCRNESTNQRQFSQFTSVYSILLLLDVFGSKAVFNPLSHSTLFRSGLCILSRGLS